MTPIPETVKQAWADRVGYPVFATADANGVPNAIYVGALDIYDDHTIVIADNYFSKTKANILAGSKAALVFLSKGGKSYQIKGSIETATDGPWFDFMKRINPAKHPGHAAAVIRVEAVFSGSQQLA
ncbi:MAG: pyridoxamine 5'-phosphate oxidase family protein [Verrucomicrobiales bacterium]|nr:pyridoxamine 5'-phosphate oxidase family protein [Verrucomicrobiota bacterium JB025]